MKIFDFGKHVETIIFMEQGSDGVYRPIENVANKDVPHTSLDFAPRQKCWVSNLLDDWGRATMNESDIPIKTSGQYSCDYEPDCDYQGAVPVCPNG